MTASRDPDRLIRAFLREGEEELHDQVFDAVRADIEQTRQRAFIGPWRFPLMSNIVKVGLAAAAVVAAVFLGTQLLGSPGGLGAEPTAEPTVEATPTPEPSVPEPTSSADAFLPEGPILIWDPQREAGTSPGGATVTVTISAPGWQFNDDYQFLHKGTDEVDDAVMWPGSWAPGTGVYVYADPCRWQSTLPETPARTVDEVVTSLAAQPTLDASQPVDVTIGGYAGKAIILSRPEESTDAECDGGESGIFQTEVGTGPDLVYGAPGQTNEFWFGDVDGSLVMMLGRYLPDTPDESVEELRAIVESATFELP
jgi:hypothetical protein